MGVVFGIAFFIGLFIIALVPFVLGVVGLVIGKSRKKKGETTPKAIKPLSIVAIVIGSIIIAIPVSFFGFIFVQNATLRDDVTITDIVIEEYGYQGERFTADGVVYVACELYTHLPVSKADAVFTYKYGDGILDRSQIGNYYSVDNPYGYDLVCNEYGYLFCPESQKSSIVERFYKLEEYRWGVCGELLSEEAAGVFDAFIEDPAIRSVSLTLDRDGPNTIYIIKTSSEGLIWYTEFHDAWYYGNPEIASHEILVYEDKVYYVRDCSFDHGETTYTLLPMPPVIAEEVLNAYNNYYN